MTKKIQFTSAGFENIKNELKELNETKKQKAIDRLQKARAMGDLSENSEYTAAKEDLGFIEGRVRELEEIIKNAEVIEKASDENTVEIGSNLVLEVNGKKDTYTIVGEFEANPLEKRLSQTSPIGKALLGKKKGETVSIDVPAGTMQYKILDIKD
jgi:transcription elongation factor GreA